MSADPFIEQESEPQLELSELVDRISVAANGKMHTGLVCKVVAFDAARRTVDVDPVVKQRYTDGTRAPIGILPNIPIGYQSGGGFAVTFPIAVGDHVFVSFAERSIDEWLAQGGDEIEPRDLRRFSLSDGVAVALLESPGLTTPVDGSNMVIGQTSALGAKVTIYASGKVTIGTSAAELLALFGATLTALNTFAAAIVTGTGLPAPTAAAASVLVTQLTGISTLLDTIKGP